MHLESRVLRKLKVSKGLDVKGRSPLTTRNNTLNHGRHDRLGHALLHVTRQPFNWWLWREWEGALCGAECQHWGRWVQSSQQAVRTAALLLIFLYRWPLQQAQGQPAWRQRGQARTQLLPSEFCDSPIFFRIPIPPFFVIFDGTSRLRTCEPNLSCDTTP